MIKKSTPQEIADFFQGYVAMDMDERWFLYPSKPKLDVLGGWWNDEERSSINISKFVKIDKTPDWKYSLCEPVKRMDISSAIMQILMVASALSEIDHQTAEKKLMDDNIHKIADHYGLEFQMSELMIKCVDIASSANHWFRDCSGSREQLVSDIADVEIMLEQVKYLMEIDSAWLSREKNDRIELQLSLIGEEPEDEEEQENEARR